MIKKKTTYIQAHMYIRQNKCYISQNINDICFRLLPWISRRIMAVLYLGLCPSEWVSWYIYIYGSVTFLNIFPLISSDITSNISHYHI